MKIAVDISLYPLGMEFVTRIKAFIERLNAHPELQVVTNAMSTQISGEHGCVFDILKDETARAFSTGDRQVFVMKVLGGGGTV